MFVDSSEEAPAEQVYCCDPMEIESVENVSKFEGTRINIHLINQGSCQRFLTQLRIAFIQVEVKNINRKMGLSL